MANAYNAYYAKSSQERSEISSAARQGHNARRNLSKEGSRLFFALATALLFGACVQDLDNGKKERIVASDDMALVTLSLSTPATRTTRTEGTEIENKVDVVDVFLFTADDDKLYYRAPGIDITDDASTNKIAKTFTVRLPFNPLDGATPIPYKVVVLANARSQITHAPATISPAPIVDRKAFLNGLAIPVPTPAGAPIAPPFPMWGYYASDLVITESAPAPSLSIDLTRAVARVDVSVKNTVLNFELKSVHLYNYSDKGAIAPAVSDGNGNLDGYDGNQWKVDPLDNNEKKAFAPHVPPSTNRIKGPIDYATTFTRTIYAFESGAGKPVTENGWKENACLVVGGLYDDGVTAPYLTYYRVEFHNTTSGNLPLLRNHLYNVVIQEVKSHGWGTPDLAYDNLPSNIIVDITAWNDGDLNDVTFNGQYQIAVDKSHLDFYKEGNPRSLRVIADHPDAWTIEALPSWLEVESTTPAAAPNVQSTLVFAADAGDAPDLPRSGSFYLVAGNLRKEITVAQSAEEEFSMEIDPWELVFYKTPTAKTLVVTPYPTGSGYALSFVSPPAFAWADGFAFPATTPAAVTPLSFKPGVNITGNTINGTLLVTFTGPLGQTVTREVNIKQLAREVIEIIAAEYYASAGGDLEFTITSDIPWQLSESSDFLILGDESEEHAPVSSYKYTFTLVPTPLYWERSATVNVTSSDPALPSPFTFKITQNGRVLYLKITQPVEENGVYLLDFDTSTDSREVKLETNAPWQFTADAHYSNVVQGANFTPGAIYPSPTYTPDQPLQTPTITFTPTTGTPPVTGKMSTIVTFSTTASGVTNAKKQVTLKRYDPRTYMFSANYDTLTLFSTFARGSSLSGLTNTNIPELKTSSINNSVKTLVMQGDKDVILENQITGIKSRKSTSLLPNLENVSLPNFDGTIPATAFVVATWLKSIDIPKVTVISAGAFTQCDLLSRISLPEATTLGDRAFLGCDVLVEADCPKVTSTGARVFETCTSLIEVNFPILTSIGDNMFEECRALDNNVYFPEVTNIGRAGFMDCEGLTGSLTGANFPKLTYIEEYAFATCINLISVHFSKVTHVEDHAFYNCKSLVSVDLPEAYSFGERVFSHSKSTLILKINSPGSPVSFNPGTSTGYPTFHGVGDATESLAAGTTTTRMTLYLGAGVSPTRVLGSNVAWNGCTWGEIKAYEDL